MGPCALVPPHSSLPLTMLQEQHGGDNQVFSYCPSSLHLSPLNSSSLLLTAGEGGRVILAPLGPGAFTLLLPLTRFLFLVELFAFLAPVQA